MRQKTTWPEVQLKSICDSESIAHRVLGKATDRIFELVLAQSNELELIFVIRILSRRSGNITVESWAGFKPRAAAMLASRCLSRSAEGHFLLALLAGSHLVSLREIDETAIIFDGTSVIFDGNRRDEIETHLRRLVQMAVSDAAPSYSSFCSLQRMIELNAAHGGVGINQRLFGALLVEAGEAVEFERWSERFISQSETKDSEYKEFARRYVACLIEASNTSSREQSSSS